jgi:uncharacterized membrane protein
MVVSPSDEMIRGSDSASTPVNAARRSIVVNVPLERAYQQWARVEDLPKFITLLRNVRRIDDNRFFYTWHPDGEERQGTLHIVLQIPCRRIAWRMLPDPLMSGVVSFAPRSRQETEVTLKIRSLFDPPTLSMRLEEYLSNFKRLIESEDPAK